MISMRMAILGALDRIASGRPVRAKMLNYYFTAIPPGSQRKHLPLGRRSRLWEDAASGPKIMNRSAERRTHSWRLKRSERREDRRKQENPRRQENRHQKIRKQFLQFLSKKAKRVIPLMRKWA